MSTQQVYLPFWALTTLENARLYLERQDEADDDSIALLLRSVSSRIEHFCGRKLKQRDYAAAANTTVANCTMTAGSKVVTTSGTFDAVAQGALMSAAAGIQLNTQLAYKYPGVNNKIEISKPASASATGTITFIQSDTRLVLSGDGCDRLDLGVAPVDAVNAAWYVDDNAVETAISLTAKRIVREAGLLILGSQSSYLFGGAFPKGDYNILVSATAGYKPGVDEDELFTLEQACLRWLQVEFQNKVNQVGRTIQTNLGESKTITLSEEPIPADVKAMLMPFVRLHG